MEEVEPPGAHAARPDPRLIASAMDFARSLRVLRAQAGFSIRELGGILEKRSGDSAASSTLGGWLSGSHLPTPKLVPALSALLSVCGVTDHSERSHWLAALDRVRQPPGRRPVDSPSPFRGLEVYEPEHAAYFRGREALVEELVALLRGPHQHGSMIMAVGPSGSGKSSLLRAGLIPALGATAPDAVGSGSGSGSSRKASRPAADQISYLLFTPGRNPVRELARQLARLSGADVPQLEARLLADPASCAEVVRGHTSGRVLLVLDQFEELFTACKEERLRTAFIDALCAAAGPGFVALGMRADFYAHAARYAQLVPVMQNAQILVGPMTTLQLRQAITEPAMTARLSLGDGLVELLLRELAPAGGSPAGAGHEVGTLPLLSHALLAAWEESKGRTITVEHYLAAGGIQDAITRTAEAAYSSLTTLEQQIVARRIFTRLVRSGHDTLDTRRRVAITEFLDDADPAYSEGVREVLDQFIVARLITVDEDSIQLAHEALLTAWPRLRGWLEADQTWLRLHRRLADTAKEWADTGRDPDRLYRGGLLQLIQEWTEERGRRHDLNTLERDFVDRSLAQRDQEQDRVRRRTRRRYQLLAFVTALVLLAAGVLAFALQANSTSNRERIQALSRSVAAESDRLRDQDVSLSMQLALEAYQISPTPEARSSLLNSTDDAADVRTLVPKSIGGAETVAASADGSLLAVGTGNGPVLLYAMQAGGGIVQLGAPLTGPSKATVTAAFSGNAHLLATGGDGGDVFIWETSNPAQPHRIAHLTGSADILSLALSTDGRLLATGDADDSVHLWNISDPAHPVVLPTPVGAAGSANSPNGIEGVAFTPNGQVLAAGGDDDNVRLWNTADSALLSTINVPGSHVFSVAFSPDGSTLAAGTGADHAVHTWNVSTPSHPTKDGAPLTGPTDWVNYVAFSPDGKTLAAASSDDDLWLYNLSTRQPIAQLPHPDPVTRAAFRGNDSLLTVATDGTVRDWSVPGPVITGARGAIFSVSYDTSGNELGVAPGSPDTTATIWNATDPQHPTELGPPLADAATAPEYSGSGVLTPDGHTFIVGDLDGSIQLWNVTDPANPRELGPPVHAASALVETVAVSADQRLLAVGADDGAVHLLSFADRAHPQLLATMHTALGKPVYQAVFDPASNLVAAADADQHVYVWNVSDPAKPRLLATLGGFTNAAYTVAFSHDGQLLAAGSVDHTVRVWNMSDPNHPTAIGQPLTGPVATVYSIAFAPHSDLLAASDIDASIWLWDLSTPSKPVDLATLTGATKGLLSVTFSPDGRTLAAGGFDDTVRLWDTDPGTAATWICGHIGAPITPAEWSQYLPGLAYAPPCR